jgi:hypothetical protein
VKTSKLAHASLFNPFLTAEVPVQMGFGAELEDNQFVMFGDSIMVSSSRVKMCKNILALEGKTTTLSPTS